MDRSGHQVNTAERRIPRTQASGTGGCPGSRRLNSQGEIEMKAISVFPGKPNSVHVADLPKPSLDQVPNGRGVLVKVLRVGVDGTDKEINAAEYGAAPPGYDFLVIGHEGVDQAEAAGPYATEVSPADYAVATCRRPAKGTDDLHRPNDMPHHD